MVAGASEGYAPRRAAFFVMQKISISGEIGSMRVLVACEESQAVTTELRKLGHEAYSCDIQPCSGGHSEWHLKVDALELLKMKWDMIIAHPPCTHLCSSGARWFAEGKKPWSLQEEAAEFFMQFAMDEPHRNQAQRFRQQPS